MCHLPDLSDGAGAPASPSGAPNRIAEWRRARGLTQADLAERCGAHWVTISKWERGVTDVTISMLIDIGRVLKVRPADLLPLSEQYPARP